MEANNKKDISSIILTEHRCSCGKLLFKGLLLSSTLQIKCKRCDAMTVISNTDAPQSNTHYSILFTLDGRIIDTSPSAPQILGYTKEELLSMNMRNLDPLFNVSAHQNFSTINDSSHAEPFIWETIHQNKEGTFFLVSTNLRYIKNPTGMYGLAAFERQNPSDNHSHNTNNHCTLLAKINHEGIFTHVSAPLATLLGYSSLEMLGKYIFDFYPVKQQEKLKQTLLQNLASKESFKIVPCAMFGKNNNTINLESYFASDVNDQGQFTGFKIMSWPILLKT